MCSKYAKHSRFSPPYDPFGGGGGKGRTNILYNHLIMGIKIFTLTMNKAFIRALEYEYYDANDDHNIIMIFHIILSVPQNTVMDPNNVMMGKSWSY